MTETARKTFIYDESGITRDILVVVVVICVGSGD